jgi:hypothetical protein
MNPQEFLDLADELALGVREGDWRTSVSRAYYAAFHAVRLLFTKAGFVVPQGEQAHAYLWRRLSNSGHPDTIQAGRDLSDLRRVRNWAEYDLARPFPQTTAIGRVAAAIIIRLLEDLFAVPTVFAAVIDAIKVYERDVLKQVTWRHP